MKQKANLSQISVLPREMVETSPNKLNVWSTDVLHESTLPFYIHTDLSGYGSPIKLETLPQLKEMGIPSGVYISSSSHESYSVATFINLLHGLEHQYPEDTADIVELRDISLEEAKEEIARYFRAHDGIEIGYDELIDELRLELPLVVEACHELEKEGKIG